MLENAEPVMINGEEIPTVIEDDQRIVDPEFIEKHKLTRTKYGQHIEVPINIGNNKLLEGIDKLGLGDYRGASPEEKFIGVVEALGKIQQGNSITGVGINPTTEDGRDRLRILLGGHKKFPNALGGRTLLRPLLKIASYAGLKKDDVGDPASRKPKQKTQLQLDFVDFENSPDIVYWRKNHRANNASYNQNMVRKLHTALYLLDMSTETLLSGIKMKKVMREIEGEQVFTWINTQGIAKEKHEWLTWIDELVGYTDKKFKTWMDSTGKQWNLVEFANAPNPDVYAGNNDMTKQGKKIRPEVSALFKGGQGRIKAFKEALKHFLATWGKVNAGKYPSGTFFYVGAPVLQYGTLYMENSEILGMYECLKTPVLKFTEKKASVEPSREKYLRQQRSKNKYFGMKMKVSAKTQKRIPNKYYARQMEMLERATKIAGKPIYEEFNTTMEDWKDASDYFLYAVEIGWRANEAFTAGTNTDPTIIDAKKKSGIWFPNEEKTFMVIKFLTRKTWGISDRKPDVDRYTTTVDVMDKDVISRVNERLAQINEGLKASELGATQKELYDTYGIRTQYTTKAGLTKQNDVHALIGKDGKYIGLGTMELQAKDDMTTDELNDLRGRDQEPEVMKTNDTNQAKLRAIMRFCYKKVFPKKHAMESYWTSNSLHSLRHVFAQAWLARSGQDFQWVANRGHWGGIAILEQAYGQPNERKQLAKTVKYSNTTLAQAEKADNTDAEDDKDLKDLKVDPKTLAKLLELLKQQMNDKWEDDKPE